MKNYKQILENLCKSLDLNLNDRNPPSKISLIDEEIKIDGELYLSINIKINTESAFSVTGRLSKIHHGETYLDEIDEVRNQLYQRLLESIFTYGIMIGVKTSKELEKENLIKIR